MKKVLLMALCMIMALSLFACKSGPKNTEELIKESTKQKTENCRIGGTLDMTISTEYSGTSFEMPINVKVDMETTKEVGHGKLNMDMELLGQKQSQESEVYVDNQKKVTYTKTDGKWSKSEGSSSIGNISNEESLESLKNFKFAETKEGYTLTGTLKTLKESGIFDSIGMKELENVKMEDGEIIYSFNKDCQITRVQMKDVKMSISEQGTDGSATINADLKITDHGKVKDIEIPAEAK